MNISYINLTLSKSKWSNFVIIFLMKGIKDIVYYYCLHSNFDTAKKIFWELTDSSEKSFNHGMDIYF